MSQGHDRRFLCQDPQFFSLIFSAQKSTLTSRPRATTRPSKPKRSTFDESGIQADLSDQMIDDDLDVNLNEITLPMHDITALVGYKFSNDSYNAIEAITDDYDAEIECIPSDTFSHDSYNGIETVIDNVVDDYDAEIDEEYIEMSARFLRPRRGRNAGKIRASMISRLDLVALAKKADVGRVSEKSLEALRSALVEFLSTTMKKFEGKVLITEEDVRKATKKD